MKARFNFGTPQRRFQLKLKTYFLRNLCSIFSIAVHFISWFHTSIFFLKNCQNLKQVQSNHVHFIEKIKCHLICYAKIYTHRTLHNRANCPLILIFFVFVKALVACQIIFFLWRICEVKYEQWAMHIFIPFLPCDVCLSPAYAYGHRSDVVCYHPQHFAHRHTTKMGTRDTCIVKMQKALTWSRLRAVG